jgi:LytS/YehU family sensor histidine kinase
MLASPLFSSILITALVTVASSLLVIWNNWEKARANEQERTLQKIAAELSVLKLQISPHFLFNTLNNIRWLVRSHSENAEPALVKLSQLLRYILYQASNDRVSLEKEVEHLQDYISLQKMRIPEQESIRFEIAGKLEGRTIVPLLLIPILENFFKHGTFGPDANGLIMLTMHGNSLNFRTANKIAPRSPGAELDEKGIGLENVKRRLALHYPNQHTFRHYEDNGYYFVNLEIEKI